MSGKKHQTVEPVLEQSTPASAVQSDETVQADNVAPNAETEQPAPVPTKVQALKSNGGGGRRVLATAHINRVGGKLSPGDEFELVDEKEEKRLAGAFKEI